MLDSGASTNVMTLEIMNELGLKISKPYRNVQAMDSREVQVCEVIKNLEVHLQECPEQVLIMDVVVIDCLVKWGMLLSRKWAAYQRYRRRQHSNGLVVHRYSYHSGTKGEVVS
jgi:hypothetical protein